MKCQRNLPEHNGIFAFASWILFSPNNIRPSRPASLTISGGCAFGDGEQRDGIGLASDALARGANALLN